MSYSNKVATEIMIQIQNGDNSRMEELYLMFKDKMKKIISNRNRVFPADWDDEDHCSEVFITILDKIMKFDSARAGFTTWLNYKEEEVYSKHVTKHKKVIKEKDMITGEVLKKYVSYRCPLMQINEENEEHFIIDEAEHSVMSAEDELIAHMTEKGLFDEIKSLPNDYRQTIHLCELQGLKPTQAAKIMGYKPSVFYNKHSRALKRLTAYAQGEGLLDDRYAYVRKERVMDEHDELDL